MELKDIVLNRGDRIYFETSNYLCAGDEGNLFDFLIDTKKNECDIIKIERPIKYEIIYEIPKEILDKEEKEYLENFLRPFRNKIRWIAKYESYKNNEYIAIQVRDERYLELPDFKFGTMYKGMELNKEYTLNELGLFEGE